MAFDNIYAKKRVLITGNTGFKGTWLATWLVKLGAEVHGLSNGVPTTPSLFEAASHRTRLGYHEHDVTDLHAVHRVISTIKPDFVSHLAAQSLVRLSYDDPGLTFRTNFVGTLNVLEALRQLNQPCCAVIITSDKAYDNVEWVWGYRETDALGGKDPYSASKGAAELVIRSYAQSFFNQPDSRVRVAVGRAGNVIGGGDWAKDRIVPDAIRSWSVSRPVEVRSAQATRPWQHVLEPLSGYLTLAGALYCNQQLTGEAFNFGPKAENNFTVVELLQAMQAHWPSAEWSMLLQGKDVRKEARLLKLNCDKALHSLSWTPTLSFPETAEFTARWYRNYYFNSVPAWDFTCGQIEQFESLARARSIRWASGQPIS